MFTLYNVILLHCLPPNNGLNTMIITECPQNKNKTNSYVTLNLNLRVQKKRKAIYLTAIHPSIHRPTVRFCCNPITITSRR